MNACLYVCMCVMYGTLVIQSDIMFRIRDICTIYAHSRSVHRRGRPVPEYALRIFPTRNTLPHHAAVLWRHNSASSAS